MLQEIDQEWNQACINQRLVEAWESTPGKLAFQKTIVTFRGVEMELTISAVDPSVGIDVDRPETFTRRLTALNTQRNVKLPDMNDENADISDVYAAILRAIDPAGDQEAAIIERRNKAFKSSIRKESITNWTKRIKDTGAYSKNEIDNFIAYCSEAIKRPYFGERVNKFVDVLVKFSNEITDTTPCYPNDTSFTEQHALYNDICKWMSGRFTNLYGDNTIARTRLEKGLIDTERDATLHPHTLKIKNIVRGIYQECEKPVTFCFVLDGLARYFEKVTGESVAYRLADMKERAELRRERRERFKQQHAEKSTTETKVADHAKDETKEVKTEKRNTKPVPKKKTVKTEVKQPEPIAFNPLGNDMFSRALEEAKPLKK